MACRLIFQIYSCITDFFYANKTAEATGYELVDEVSYKNLPALPIDA